MPALPLRRILLGAVDAQDPPLARPLLGAVGRN